jgi:hypothetical protein
VSKQRGEQIQRCFGHQQVLFTRAVVLQSMHTSLQDGGLAQVVFVGEPAGENAIHAVDPDIAPGLCRENRRLSSQRAVQSEAGLRLAGRVNICQAVESLLNVHGFPGWQDQRGGKEFPPGVQPAELDRDGLGAFAFEGQFFQAAARGPGAYSSGSG